MTYCPKDHLTPFVDKERLNETLFVARTLNMSAISQMINVESFSVLIDDHRAAYNLSGRAGCYGSSSNYILLGIRFLRESLLDSGFDSSKDLQLIRIE